MKAIYRDRIEAALPRGFRIKFVPGGLEGPVEFIWRICPPNYHCIQKASRLGFLGLFRGWQTIGELDDNKDIIFLRKEHFDEFSPIIKNILAKISLSLPIEKGLTLNERNWQRLMGGPF